MTYKNEQFSRKECVELINQTAKRLQLPEPVVMTAVVYMHRFFMHHSMTTYPSALVSMTSLWTASKVEKHERKLEDIIIHGYYVSFKLNIDNKPPMFYNLMNDIRAYEKVLVKTLRQLKLEHPQVYINKFCEYVGGEHEVENYANNLARCSMNSTTMCLRYSPKTLACLFIYVVTKGRGYWHILCNPLPNGERWYTFFGDVKEEMLEVMAQELENGIYESDEGLSQEPSCGSLETNRREETSQEVKNLASKKLEDEANPVLVSMKKKRRIQNDDLNAMVFDGVWTEC